MGIDEPYYFLRMYSVDLSAATAALKLLKRFEDSEIRHALFRDLIVTYVRPFSVNQGRDGKNVLSMKRHVPKTMRLLHKELVRVRMQQFAHTDLSYYSPRLSTVFGYGMVFKGYDYEALLRRLAEIDYYHVTGSLNLP